MEKNSQEFSENQIKLPIEQFLALQETNMTLDHIYLLQYLEKGGSAERLRGVKVSALIQYLTRKGLLSNGCMVTKAGGLILESFRYSSFVMKPERAKTVVDSAALIDFENWWKAYPSTDIFEYKGKKFKGNRGLRAKKDACKELYTKIINEGEFTAEDLLRALDYEVLIKKEASVREGENKLKYMVNTHTYLYQRLFENFVAISKEKPLTDKTAPGSIDI
jgi:hypothetical protein